MPFTVVAGGGPKNSLYQSWVYPSALTIKVRVALNSTSGTVALPSFPMTEIDDKLASAATSGDYVQVVQRLLTFNRKLLLVAAWAKL